MHGYQVWVAQAEENEEGDPLFQYFPADQIPQLEKSGLHIKVIAGSAYGIKSPLQVDLPMYMIDIHALESADLDVAGELKGEIAIVVVKGEVTIDKEAIGPGKMVISKTENECSVNLQQGSVVLLFGGAPLEKPRHMLWNFVSTQKEKLKAAAQQWKDNSFPKVPGDDTYVPFPPLRTGN
jgi:hypothetical protein